MSVRSTNPKTFGRTLAKRRGRTNYLHLIVVALVTFALINVMGILNSVPVAFASTCNQAGGEGSSGHYVAYAYNSGGDEYGSSTVIDASGWTINTGYNGSSSVWVQLDYDDSVPWPGDWLAAGLIAGVGDNNQYSSSRIMFYEWHSTVGNGFYWYTSDGIPSNDGDTAQVWTSTQNSDGTYIGQLYIYSPYWSTSISVGENTGTYDYKGTALVGSENTYLSDYGGTYHPYSGNCNSIQDNDESQAQVSTAISTSGSWSNWGSSHSTYSNSPYSTSVYSNTEFYESGS